jgi:hypothetical protein
MSNIPYQFIPIPRYFYDNGLFKDSNCLIFVTWAFSRCNSFKRKIYHNHQDVELEPFEFIFGRDMCAQETGLSHREIRTQLDKMVDNGLLGKTTSRSTQKFSVFRWHVEAMHTPTRFVRGDQQNDQLSDQQNDQQKTLHKYSENTKMENNRPAERPAERPAKRRVGDHKQEQENTRHVLCVTRDPAFVLSVKKKNTKGEEFLASSEELYSFAVRKKKDWTPDEIEEAWKIFCEYNAPVSDWLAFIGGTITKRRNLKTTEQSEEKQWKSEQKSYPQKNNNEDSKSEPKKHNKFYSEKDIAGSPLAIYARQNGYK